MNKFELVVVIATVVIVAVLATGITRLYHHINENFNDCADTTPSCQILK